MSRTLIFCLIEEIEENGNKKRAEKGMRRSEKKEKVVTHSTLLVMIHLDELSGRILMVLLRYVPILSENIFKN